MSINRLLTNLNACNDAKLWAKDKSWKEIFETCHRGDWLLWLYKKTNQGDLKKFTLAKAHCANTVRHLMKDVRSISAVDIAIRFGNGEATREELADAAAYAATAYAAAYAATAYAAAYAATAAAAAAYAAAAAADAAYAADAAAAAADTKQNQKLTADICRKYLPLTIWNINEDLIDL